jgi:hypothetical protein
MYRFNFNYAHAIYIYINKILIILTLNTNQSNRSMFQKLITSLSLYRSIYFWNKYLLTSQLVVLQKFGKKLLHRNYYSDMTCILNLEKKYTLSFCNIQLLTFVEVYVRIYWPRYMIFTEAEAEVNIIYLGTIHPYINRNESQ